MSSCNFHHHDPMSSSYKSHVIRIRDVDHCLGCFSNKIFLGIFLPFLMGILIFPNYLFDKTIEYSIILTLWAVFSISSIMTFIRPKRYLIYGISYSTYMIVTILYVLVVPETKNLGYLWAIFVLPQYIDYVFRSIYCRELTNRLIKSIIRLSFVSGIFLFFQAWSNNPLLFSAFGVFSLLLFYRMRSFSSYRIEGERLYISHPDNKYLNTIIPHQVFDSVQFDETKLETMNYWQKVYYWFAIVALFFSSIVVKHESRSCATEQAFAASNFQIPCEECGEMNSTNAKFCQFCGNELPAKGQEIDTTVYSPTQQQAYQPPYQPPYQDPYQQQGYYQPQPVRTQEYGFNSKHLLISMLIGIIVIFLVTTDFTTSLIGGSLLGAFGYLITLAVLAGGCNAWTCYCCGDCCCDGCMECACEGCCDSCEC
ncbi:MAG: zinc ribbon domain-containing protein [Candidatus Heimdallarchaeota archaeon]|nr:zinc ribbon domain-containing protein [Candidatus Heimdallarchaeota archaeon]